MKKDKYFILLPDGIGLRNFAYTKFYEYANSAGDETIFWNATPFNLSDIGIKELKIPSGALHKFTEVYKNARKNIELRHFEKRTKNQIYRSYKFPRSNSNLKSILKNLMTSTIIFFNSTRSGLERVRQKVIDLEKSTSYYKACLEQLQREMPKVVFCTNQRPSVAIAPIEAAKSLGIPTVTFIFSWDNLPKATMVLETDYYLVWSDHMKNELLFYYPYINEEQIIITGTPQFEGHFDQSTISSKEDFYKEYGLSLNKRYICFSGDDITTSPNDQYYLEDTAKAVKTLNENGHDIGIIFRRCPVDFSERYDFVLENYKDIIVPIAPKWDQAGEVWNAIKPTKEDTKLLANTAEYTDLVINVGSSMVYDYICHEKPCAFINYNTGINVLPSWRIEKIYKYVHFKSMPNKKAVIWINDKNAISEIIKNAIDSDHLQELAHAKNWFDKIIHDPENASRNIWDALSKIVTEHT
ncbi:MAG: UDP-glycosyltransferase [Flavobacteriaceae bacterium]|nr:UDP-glycosyltransferase [Bacteroidia bacterium]NNL61579.1 UDP-glycosyltransferase [Flavobacteriaceae bacterium]